MGDYIVSAMAGGSDSFMDNLDANSLFLVQCVIAGTIGGLEFCFPALFVDTFNTFEVYTSHRLYGATMIVNAIIVYTMRETKDHKIKREIVQAFLFQFGLHIIVLPPSATCSWARSERSPQDTAPCRGPKRRRRI